MHDLSSEKDEEESGNQDKNELRCKKCFLIKASKICLLLGLISSLLFATRLLYAHLTQEPEPDPSWWSSFAEMSPTVRMFVAYNIFGLSIVVYNSFRRADAKKPEELLESYAARLQVAHGYDHGDGNETCIEEADHQKPIPLPMT